MNDLTQHQIEIMAAMMHGKRIEKMHYGDQYIQLTPQQALLAVSQYPRVLRIAPEQDDVTVRLYGGIEPNFQGLSRGSFHDLWCFGEDQTPEDKYFIQINPKTGSITGGKL